MKIYRHILALFSAFAIAALASRGHAAESAMAAKSGVKKASATVSAAAVPASPGKSRFQFVDAELKDVIGTYAKLSGRKIVVDPSVRGKISIFSPTDVDLDEAFNLLSSALAVNGFAFSEQGDTLILISARNAERSLIPTLTELPPLKPERMVTLVLRPKNLSVEEVNKRLRILPSKDGEMTPYEPTNSLIVTDWVSNLHRIAKIFAELDQAPSAAPQAPAKATIK